MPYGPYLASEITSLPQPIVTFQSTVIIGGKEASVSGVYVGEEALKRYLSCMILMNLPSQGVTEAFEWLVDAWQFYVHPPISPGPAIVQAPIQVTGGKAVDRPPLIIDDD